MEPIAGCEIHQLDFLADDADDLVKGWLGGKADVVMSDMAAAASGHKGTDHLRIIALVEAALAFAFDVLEEGGTFVAKVLAGGAENEMQAMLKKNFKKVANVKPPASRSDSSLITAADAGLVSITVPWLARRQPFGTAASIGLSPSTNTSCPSSSPTIRSRQPSAARSNWRNNC